MTCTACASVFMVKAYEVERGGGKFCSKACYFGSRNNGNAGTKHCGRCDRTLDVTHFWARPGRKPGALMSWCKACQTEHGRPFRKKYALSEAGKAAAKRSRLRHPKRWNPEVHRRAAAKYRARRSEFFRIQHCAGQAVQRALKAGVLVRPAACSACGVSCKPDAHHHRGYDKAYWLDVRWLCRRCHIDHDRGLS